MEASLFQRGRKLISSVFLEPQSEACPQAHQTRALRRCWQASARSTALLPPPAGLPVLALGAPHALPLRPGSPAQASTVQLCQALNSARRQAQTPP